MWSYELSNGHVGNIKTSTKQETLYNVALVVRIYINDYKQWMENRDKYYSFMNDGDFIFKNIDFEYIEMNEPEIPDIYIYNNGVLDEIIKGDDLK